VAFRTYTKKTELSQSFSALVASYWISLASPNIYSRLICL